MSSLEPLDHIARVALPWRQEAHFTECGKLIADLGDRVVSRATIQARIKDIGQKRAAYTTCMTCADTSDRWNGSRRDTMILAVQREADAVAHVSPPNPGTAQYVTPERMARIEALWQRHQQFAAELEAITALVVAHREEFDGYLSDRERAVSLDERRTRRRTGQQRGGRL